MKLTPFRRSVLEAIRDGHSRAYVRQRRLMHTSLYYTLDGRGMRSDWAKRIDELVDAGWVILRRSTSGRFYHVGLTAAGASILVNRVGQADLPVEA